MVTRLTVLAVVIGVLAACDGGSAPTSSTATTAAAAPTAPTVSTTTTHTGTPTAVEPAPEIVLTQGGGCGDAFFWAADDAGTVAVTVSIEARKRSATEPTVRDFDMPDPAVVVEVQRGVALTEGFCNDVLQNHRIDETVPVVSGAGSIFLAPAGDGFDSCGLRGRLQLRDAVTEDGMVVAPIDVSTDQIGCYAG